MRTHAFATSATPSPYFIWIRLKLSKLFSFFARYFDYTYAWVNRVLAVSNNQQISIVILATPDVPKRYVVLLPMLKSTLANKLVSFFTLCVKTSA